MKSLNKKRRLLGMLAASILAGGISCSKSHLELDNPNDATLNNFWTTEEEALIGLSGVFDGFQHRELTAQRYRELDILTDNATTVNNGYNWLDIETSNHTPTVQPVENFWLRYYTVINRANLVMESVEAMPEEAISEEARKRMVAEAAFLRAYAYLDLTALYGDVPFYTRSNGPFDEAVGKTPQAEIHAFMREDLETRIISALPPDLAGDEQGRITSWAARALLGKYYLYNGEWEKAASEFQAVIDSKMYALYPDYGRLFTPDGEYSTENLFEIGFITGGVDDGENYSVQVDTNLAPIVPNTTWRPMQNLVDSYSCTDGLPVSGPDASPLYDPEQPFSNRDPRLRATVFTNADTTSAGGGMWNFRDNRPFAVKKYTWFTSTQYQNNQGPQNYYMIRYADVLLMFAEAQNEASGPDATVYGAVNEVRARAGMPELPPGLDQEGMRTRIQDERRWEFALEHQRYFDLKRWGIIEEVINGLDDRMEFTLPRDLLWPYPQVELDNNPVLAAEGQNPGW